MKQASPVWRAGRTPARPQPGWAGAALLLLLCSPGAWGQGGPAPGPSLAAQVNPTPLFSGQSFELTPSAGSKNAQISAQPAYTVRPDPRVITAMQLAELELLAPACCCRAGC